jgi:quercetin dioxygenase-like cupin family protein
MKILSPSKLKPGPISNSKTIFKKVFAKKGFIPTVTQIAQVEFKPGDIAPEHKHKDMYEIFYVVSGQGIVKMTGKLNQIKTGDTVIIEPNEPHEFLNTSDKNLSMFYFGVVKK